MKSLFKIILFFIVRILGYLKIWRKKQIIIVKSIIRNHH